MSESENSGQWAVGSGQWAVGSGQWAVGSWQWAWLGGQGMFRICFRWSGLWASEPVWV